MNAIEINNASYTYSPDTPFKKLALDDVSLTATMIQMFKNKGVHYGQ